MSYTFSARAVAFQNCQTSSVTFTVDTQAPSVYFDSAAAPKTPSNLEIVNFKFSTTDTASTGFKEFQCSLDGAPFVKCNSDDPFTISGDKQHVFKLRAMDEAGNINEMQPPYTWTTDFTKPGVRFDNPALPNARTNVQDFAFAFSSTAQDWKEFQCADERDGNYSTCASGTGRHFDDGSRTFCVKAVDHAGNIGEPACHTWFVDTVRPRVVLDLSPGKTPRNPTNKESASFEFSSPDDDVGKFQCALNGNSEQSFRDCNSHDSYPIVQEGIQTFYVRVVDAAGNVSEPPASYSWNVDLTEPIIAINREPKPRSTTRDAEFAFSSEPGAVFECALEDSGGLSFTSCHSPCRFSVGTDGIQKFYVKAIDLAGNEVLVNREWEVDTQLPEVLVTEPSREALTRAKLPFFRGQTERNSIVHIWVDGKEYGLTPSGPSGDWYFFPRDEALSLAEGRHTVSASAIDSFGNTGNFSESVVFFIDSIPPDTNIVTYPPKAHRSYKSDFSFSSTEEGVEYECQIDAGKFLPCGKNHSFDSLAVGQHTLAVAAKDKAGNVDPNPATYVWSIYFERPLYPDISEPADGARVETGTPTISGKTVPNGTVIIFIDGEPSEKTASADGNGLWTFQPPARLAPGRHSLSGETRDVDGTPSESRSPEIFFTVVIPSEVNQAIGGGLGGCSSSGTAGSSSFFWGLFALIVFRRRCRS
ncbi:Ig-like domain-containing protein [Cystobacter fuscus]|uniref:Ig-like domain-containing protein n=1 Tax=Cystobacter fuscus TaxID=43 RepID=UPI0037BE5E8B